MRLRSHTTAAVFSALALLAVLYAAAPARVARVVATRVAPANAEELPSCAPAPVLTGQMDVWSDDRKSVQSQATFRVEAANAPCYADFYQRVTDDAGNVGLDVKRYYFIPQPLPTPEPTATPEQPTPTPTVEQPSPTPPPATPTPTPAPTPKPCVKRGNSGKCK